MNGYAIACGPDLVILNFLSLTMTGILLTVNYWSYHIA